MEIKLNQIIMEKQSIQAFFYVAWYFHYIFLEVHNNLSISLKSNRSKIADADAVCQRKEEVFFPS